MTGNGDGRGREPPLIVGESEPLRKVVALARRFAPTDLPILVLGATGTGKELLAQHIHYWSGRRGEMVDVNCAALPRDLVEAELFGHGPRAFTGALDGRPGLIEAADRGTLFLDEVGSLAWEAQGKLLRVLETSEVRRVGETGKRRVDVRVIAAAQRGLSDRVRAGEFRGDLYHRLAGVVVALLPLAERPEDIGPLARYFGRELGQDLAPGVVPRLERYAWPGNVRELRHVMARAAALVANGTVTAVAVRDAMALGAVEDRRGGNAWRDRYGPPPDPDRLVAICQASQWQVSRIADAFGVRRTMLFERLRAWGYSLRELRRRAGRPVKSAGHPPDDAGLSPVGR